ncbi:MAG: sulfatase [Planctomycetota bacterium]
MKKVSRLIVLCWAATIAIVVCVGVVGGSALAADRPNVLLICVDDLRPELNCYGVDYISSPNIDALADGGLLFERHYVQAPTCGASRYALLTGRYGGASNGALFQRAARIAKGEDKEQDVPPSMPAWFRLHGYTTVSVGKVSHHPGGRGGPDWDDEAMPEMPNSWDRHLLPAGAWKHPRGWMHGLANGEIRGNAKDMDVFQSLEGPDAIYPDGGSTAEAVRQLKELSSDDDKPFFLAFGILRPHLPFGAPAKYMQHYRDAKLPVVEHPNKPTFATTWHGSGEFMKYNRWNRNPNVDDEFAIEVRKHYAACVSYADAQVGKILAALESSQAAKNTIVVLWGDHGWHLGEHAIWGKHSLFEESLRSPLIIRAPAKSPEAAVQSGIVESIDVFPTLCELSGLPISEFGNGKSLVGYFEGKTPSGTAAVSYFKNARTIRTAGHRLVVHQKGNVELYDWKAESGESKNIADENPAIVSRLQGRLNSKLADQQ